MRRGAWHQFGDRSQKLALEQLQMGVGVGAIISPRDLNRQNAVEYASEYRNAGADVLADPQFYIPDSTEGHLGSHDTAQFRQSIKGLGGISDHQLHALGDALVAWNRDLDSAGVIAPAVVYEAGRSDIVDLNASLFDQASRAAKMLGVPAYATVVLGQSVTGSDVTLDEVLGAATALSPDGWYFSFEFREPRIPSSKASVQRFLETGIALACTGLPVMHAYAGPMALLSRACGMAAAGIGHSQNTWQFTQARWLPAREGGGGGAAPPRLFCPKLWGTIVYEDEVAQMSPRLRGEIYSASPFSAQVKTSQPYLPWNKWDANKHLVHQLCIEAGNILAEPSAKKAAAMAIGVLDEALLYHARIAGEGIALTDGTARYQAPWRQALADFGQSSSNQIELFELL